MASSNGEQRSLHLFSPVEIDENSRQKYVLIKASDENSLESVFLVRGKRTAEYHADAAEDTVEELWANGFTAEITGGGRIEHSSESKSIVVFGYSMQFGRGDHAKASEMIKEKYPEYNVDWNNDGY